MLQGIKSIVHYKKKNNTHYTHTDNSVSLAEEHNNCKPIGNPGTSVLLTYEVQQHLCSINTRIAAGPANWER